MTITFRPYALVYGALVGLALAAHVAAAPVTVNSSSLITQADNGSSVDTNFDNITAFGTRTLSSTFGGSSSTIYTDWQDTGSGALFDFDFDQVRPGAWGSTALASQYGLQFTVGQSNTTYSLSGLYSVKASASNTYARTALLDLTTGIYLFEDTSQSFNTANESFGLGVVGDGDDNNYNTGSLTGTLLAGHRYSLAFSNYTQAYPFADEGATATGCLTLSLGGATGGGNCGRIPEPGSLALAGLALAGLGLARRGRAPLA